MRVVVIGIADDPADAERLRREGADAVQASDGQPTLDTPEDLAAAIVRGATTVRTRNVHAARRVADVLAVVADVEAEHDDATDAYEAEPGGHGAATDADDDRRAR